MKRQAQSRTETRERRSSRVRSAGLMVVALAVLGAGAYGVEQILKPDNFPVRTLRLSGELVHVRSEQVRKIAVVHSSEGFLRVDVDSMREEIGNLPWVREAAVRRVWPDVIRVDIREHHALARWNGSALVSTEGRVFAPPEEEWPQGLPALGGPEGSSAGVTLRYGELREILAPAGLAVASLNMSERRALQLGLHNGLVVLLGREDPEARLQRFARAYPVAIAEHAPNVEQVDLRYTNGFAVAWKKADPAA